MDKFNITEADLKEPKYCEEKGHKIISTLGETGRSTGRCINCGISVYDEDIIFGRLTECREQSKDTEIEEQTECDQEGMGIKKPLEEVEFVQQEIHFMCEPSKKLNMWCIIDKDGKIIAEVKIE